MARLSLVQDLALLSLVHVHSLIFHFQVSLYFAGLLPMQISYAPSVLHYFQHSSQFSYSLDSQGYEHCTTYVLPAAGVMLSTNGFDTSLGFFGSEPSSQDDSRDR